MEKYIWWLEDDDILIDDLCPLLEVMFGLPVKIILTEEEFRDTYRDLSAEYPPALIILDVMLMWTHPRKVMTLPPPECIDHQKAGIRCRDMLASFPATNQVPRVFYSLLSAEDLHGGTRGDIFLTRRAGHRELLACIQTLLASARARGS
jgi:hypothetical protein